ncbi:MAG TPA: saccharopine dehydrogenase NADP-binding domain-containing protein [Rhodocyclaceae bacterium]|nr:saccharopine dehydrogenase NADP-binding domain-containing protein [Rhodocyclaceae bacterium]
MAKDRTYDIVLFGATGFTGELTAEYLARTTGEHKGLRWALAGRNLEKLEQVRARLAKIRPVCANLELLQADVDDAASIRRIAESTAVVITTVGPYIAYGEPLVAACAEAGTDYVDLTGESEFVDLMWLRYHKRAQETGARIVNSCGFDSIPHDLGAWFTVKRLPKGVPIKLEGFVRAGGTFSGGTLHSAVTAFSRARKAVAASRERRAAELPLVDRKVGSTRGVIRYLRALGAWAVPMPTIDPQVVRRSARALERYGPDFRYGHYVQVKKISRVAMLLGGVGAMFAGAQFTPTRKMLLRLKGSGDGPDEQQRKKSWFSVRFIGEGGGKHIMTEVSGGDPGYGETSKMLAEAALCLAFDDLPTAGGVLTPVQCMGDALLKRLQRADILFRVMEG